MMLRNGSSRPFLVISLDFELFWGMRGYASLRAYRENILGVRQAIPTMLRLFREYGVHATWATVGFITFENKRDLLAHAPDVRPQYRDRHRDPYVYLESIGETESRDPYHYGYSLVRQIIDTPGMELASHTFSHLCCLEPRDNPGAFRADLRSSVEANARLGISSRSLVFPRHQYDAYHLTEAAAVGFSVFRGNEAHRSYEAVPDSQLPRIKRAGRVLDAYVNVHGHNLCRVNLDDSGLISVPSSRFLRPYVKRLSAFESVRLQRIVGSLRFAARTGGGYHLWWHPHNVGIYLHQNMFFLRRILEEFRRLQSEHGMCSLTMGEAARLSA